MQDLTVKGPVKITLTQWYVYIAQSTYKTIWLWRHTSTAIHKN